MRRHGFKDGYIFVETVVAMGVLSISMLVIQGAVRQAIITRGQAQDYTTARFLLKQVAAEVELQPELVASSDSGRFKKPNERFGYEWELTKVEVPIPEIPATIPEEKRERLEKISIEAGDWEGAARAMESIGKIWMRRGEPELAVASKTTVLVVS